MQTYATDHSNDEMWRLQFLSFALVTVATGCAHETISIREFITVDAALIALTHVRVIDGTGAQSRADQTIVIRDGYIADIGDTKTIIPPSNAQIFDLPGRTVVPGYVMLHEHLSFTPDGNGEVSVPLQLPSVIPCGRGDNNPHGRECWTER